jgi:hypothetical protein
MMNPVSLRRSGTGSGPFPRKLGTALIPVKVPCRRSEIIAAGPYPTILPYQQIGPMMRNRPKATNRAACIMPTGTPAIAGRNLSELPRETWLSNAAALKA